jgi:HSP20 family molecular chaperone IbpA
VTSTKKSLQGKDLRYNRKFYISKEYDPKTITAKYEDGILEISFKLKKENEPIKVKIE